MQSSPVASSLLKRRSVPAIVCTSGWVGRKYLRQQVLLLGESDCNQQVSYGYMENLENVIQRIQWYQHLSTLVFWSSRCQSYCSTCLKCRRFGVFNIIKIRAVRFYYVKPDSVHVSVHYLTWGNENVRLKTQRKTQSFSKSASRLSLVARCIRHVDSPTSQWAECKGWWALTLPGDFW